MHKHSGAHRDVKPANVLLTWDSSGRITALVSDLGWARRMPRSCGGSAGSSPGSSAYPSNLPGWAVQSATTDQQHPDIELPRIFKQHFPANNSIKFSCTSEPRSSCHSPFPCFLHIWTFLSSTGNNKSE